MKKIIPFLLLTVFFSQIAISCGSDNNDSVNTVINESAEIYEFKNVTFTYNTDGYFYFNDTFTLKQEEQTLIYMHSDLDANGNYSWILLPNDFYYYDGTNFLNLFANYEFSSTEFGVTINSGTSALPSQIYNLTFRVVVIPGKMMTKMSLSDVDFSDYASVVKYYNIDESKIKEISASTEATK